jgi:amino acid transporter
VTEARRPLRFWDLTLYAVAVGFGIRWIAYAAAAWPASLILWLVAVVGFLAPLVIATAELVGRYPGEGGLYGWTRETIGPFAGFITGWLYWTCNLPFFCGLLYFILEAFAAAIGPAATHALTNPWLVVALASGLAISVGMLHSLGLGAGKWLTNFGSIAVALLTATLLLVGLALALKTGPATDFAHATYWPPLNADGAALWAIMVFAYGGPEALAFLRDDVQGGVKQILRALALVGMLVFAAYVAGTLAMLSILRPGDASRLAGLSDAYTLGLSRLGLGALAWLPPLLLGLSALGGYSAWFAVAARLPFAIGVDRYFPAAFARRNPGTGAPVTALWVQVAAVIALVVLGQAGVTVKAAYDFLISMSVISYTLPFAFLFLAYFRVPAEAPEGVWVAPGGAAGRKVLALAGLAVTFSAIACTLVPSPDATDKLGAVVKLIVSSAVLIGLGGAIYMRAPRATA